MGGKGKRLRKLVSKLPKTMASISGKPFLNLLLEHWYKQGVTRFIFLTGYMQDIIKKQYGYKYKDSKIEYSVESYPLGTGGALKLALNNFSFKYKKILLINGDTWFPIKLKEIISNLKKTNAKFIICLKKLDCKNTRYGGITIKKNGKIFFSNKKNHKSTYINSGCYFFEARVIKKLVNQLSSKFSLESDLISLLIKKKLAGYSIYNDHFIDIGVPSDYQKAIKYFSKSKK